MLINDLLENTGAHSSTSPPCDKHNDELVEDYCETCDEPICQACLVIDHRDHAHKSIKDVYPRKKREIGKLMNEAKSNISALRAEVFSIEGEENRVRDNEETVSKDIDAFVDDMINKHTTVMERERQRLKQEVHAATTLQLGKLQDQKESLVMYLSSVEFAKQSLDCTDKFKFLRSRKEVTSKLTELRSLADAFHPCERVLYKLDQKPLEEAKMQGTGKIKVHSEYCLSMLGGEPGIVYTGRALQWCEFILTVNSDVASSPRNVLDDFRVTLLPPNEERPVTLTLEDRGNGSRGFGWRPMYSGEYKISIFNEKLFGGEAHCSPVVWKVQPALCVKSWSSWFAALFSCNYTYLSNSVFEDGQHSWRIIVLSPATPQDTSHKYIQIGVMHPFKEAAWYWQNGEHISPGNCVESSIKSLRYGDVFGCFLDLCKRQLVMYNERTKESDIWRDIDAPVRPYLSPDDFLFSQHFAVRS